MARILLIDDEADFRSTIRRMLERAGHEVVDAENGRDGLAKLEQQACDLVLTDIIMPDMEGLETVQRVRKRAPELPIIAMSGGGRVSAMRPLAVASLLGAVRSLDKPFGRAELLGAVDEALGAQSVA